MNEQTRVVLVDDHGLCRRGLKELLELRANMRVLGTTGDPDEAVKFAHELAPDLMVMDLRMPAMNGISLLRRLRDEGCELPVVILTMSDSQEDMAGALRAGARGYLLKDMDPDDVIGAICRVAQGEMVVAPAMSAKLAKILQGGDSAQPRETTVKLTAREQEILQYLASGKSNKAIARELSISHDTVKLHVRHILAKLHFTTRVEAAVFAVEHGVGSGPATPGSARATEYPLPAAPQRADGTG